MDNKNAAETIIEMVTILNDKSDKTAKELAEVKNTMFVNFCKGNKHNHPELIDSIHDSSLSMFLKIMEHYYGKQPDKFSQIEKWFNKHYHVIVRALRRSEREVDDESVSAIYEFSLKEMPDQSRQPKEEDVCNCKSPIISPPKPHRAGKIIKCGKCMKPLKAKFQLY